MPSSNSKNIILPQAVILFTLSILSRTYFFEMSDNKKRPISSGGASEDNAAVPAGKKVRKLGEIAADAGSNSESHLSYALEAKEGEGVKEENKKSKKLAGGGGSVLDKVVAAVRLLKSASGSSPQAIIKVCKTEFSYDNETFLKKAMKNGVASGVLLQSKASYLVKSDPLYVDTAESVTIQEVAIGSSERVVENGSVVQIKYNGCLDNQKGYKFDSGILRFTVGEKDVVKGMDQGVLGMKVGGRRILTIPPSLGYGKKGCAPDIPPSSTISFDVTLKDLA